MEQKTIKIAVKGFKVIDTKSNADEGIIEAYVSIFGNVDQAGEVIDRGAFMESLQRKLPKGVWSHNWEMPIATTLEAREDEKGLYIKGKLIKGVAKAEEALALLKEGAIDEFSIGYSVLEDYIGEDGFRHLKRLKLYEWSPVLVGCNPATELLSVKSLDREEEVEEEPKAEPVAEEPTEEPKKEEPVVVESEEVKELKLKITELENQIKSGKILAQKDIELINQVISEADIFVASLKSITMPLKDLLNANENVGIKVAPKSDIKTIRIRQSLKNADKQIENVLRVIKSL